MAPDGKYIFVNAFHVFLVAPALIYIGLVKPKTPAFLYTVLLVVGALMIPLHLYNAIKCLMGRMFEPAMWYLVHVLLLAPLLIYIGKFGRDRTAQSAFLALAIIGFAALAFHGTHLVKRLMAQKK
jgi:uncharacterized membrane protein